MFLEFQKITTSHPSRRSSIIVKKSLISMIDVDQFENKETGTLYTATRVELAGYPKYSFHTMTSFDDLATIIGTTDVSGNFIAGTSCSGGNTLDIVTPAVVYPFVKAKAVFNNTLSETDDYIFNPNFMSHAETVIFNDAVLASQQSALMLVFGDAAPTKVLTKLDYTILKQILQPQVIPSP